MDSFNYLIPDQRALLSLYYPPSSPKGINIIVREKIYNMEFWYNQDGFNYLQSIWAGEHKGSHENKLLLNQDLSLILMTEGLMKRRKF